MAMKLIETYSKELQYSCHVAKTQEMHKISSWQGCKLNINLISQIVFDRLLSLKKTKLKISYF